MRKVKVNGVDVTAPEGMDYEEILEYVKYQGEKYKNLKALTIEVDGEEVELTADDRGRPFDRIRRITGYLVGGMPRWNDAKRAEERDRVKHEIAVNDG